MSRAFGQDRTPAAPPRERRNSQAWGESLALVSPSGGIIVNPDGTFSIQVAAPVALVTNAVTLNYGDGLGIDSDDLVIDLATNSGLEFSTGDLQIDLDANPGLALGAGGLSVSLAVNSGLTTTGGVQIVLDTNSGLQRGAGGLSIDLDGATLSLGAGGLSVSSPEGRFVVTAVQTGAYAAAIGETVRYDPTGGTFDITLPSAVGLAGRQVKTKNVTADVTGVTIQTDGSETIDGAASLNPTAAYEITTLESDGTNWMVV